MGHILLRDGTAGLTAAQHLSGHLLPLYQILLPRAGGFHAHPSTSLGLRRYLATPPLSLPFEGSIGLRVMWHWMLFPTGFLLAHR